MSRTDTFELDQDGDTLFVMPLRAVSSLADESVRHQWERVLKQFDEAEVTNVVFDFAKTRYFGSSMLEAMLVLWKRVRGRDGSMALCNASHEGLEVLQLSKFDTLWPLCDSRQAALTAVHS
jgi:anti-anti-sigma factor